MRLLRSDTLEFETFLDDRERPEYAILSHTWGNDEVSYQDFLEFLKDRQDLLSLHRARKLASLLSPGSPQTTKLQTGLWKVAATAEQAERDGLAYFWIDTCCINKESSAELSEAINSMFKWYQASERCYAHLSDVLLPPRDAPSIETFRKSRWFTRGWTLQELLAPRKLEFFSTSWNPLGSKRELVNHLHKATNIPRGIFLGEDMFLWSLAQRMSWAAGRNTTRVEDAAYCLMGIFDINMPLLYGEGDKAFFRLQEEIVKVSDDHTLFAWRARNPRFSTWRGLFAITPAEFAGLESCHRYLESSLSAEPNYMTNRGMRLHLKLYQPPNPTAPEEYLALLDAYFPDSDASYLAILLQRVATDEFVRIFPADRHCFVDRSKVQRMIADRVLYIRPALRQTVYPHWQLNSIGTRRVSGVLFERYIQIYKRFPWLQLELEPKDRWAGHLQHFSFDPDEVMIGKAQGLRINLTDPDGQHSFSGQFRYQPFSKRLLEEQRIEDGCSAGLHEIRALNDVYLDDGDAKICITLQIRPVGADGKATQTSLFSVPLYSL